MHIARTLRPRLLAAATIAIVLASAPMPARAASKEIIELQTQVQQLLDMTQRLQSTLDTRLGIVQNLAQQTADSATQMTATVNALQQKLATQNDASNTKLETVSGQVQSLNDSIDELKSRITKLNKAVEDLQSQLQNAQNPSGASSLATPAANGSSPAAGTNSGPAVSSASAGQAPPLQETFQGGVRDYNAAKYEVATGEFEDVIHYYPLDELSGQAQFYLGEISYRRQDFATAVKSYSAVLEGFPGSPKAPAAQLRKGLALLQMNKKDLAIKEFHQLIQRHPQTPEAAQAHTKLIALGVKASAAH